MNDHPPSAPPSQAGTPVVRVVVTGPGTDEVTRDELADRLLAGEVIGLPTDTVYGMAAALARPDAVARLAVLKGRPADLPVAVLVPDVEGAQSVGRLVGRAAELARHHWPGPLTLVVPARPGVADVVGASGDTVGLRCPDHPLVRALARMVGPLATTSANLHGRPTATTAGEVAREVAGLSLVVDGGVVAGTPSTVVEITDEGLRILRAGPLRLDDAIL